MSRYERKSVVRKRNFLINLISQNLPTDERNKRQLEWERMLEADARRGISSEENVEKSILDLEFVSGVTMTKRRSRRDMSGLDVKVMLNQQILKEAWLGDVRLPVVWVQVKSSDTGMDSYMKRYLKSSVSMEEAMAKMWEHKIILLNGNKPVSDVQHEFTKGVYDLWEYWRRDQ